MTFIGVDGGGTNTEFLMTDHNGNRLAEHQCIASNFNETGIRSLTKIISQGILTVLREGGKTLKDLKGVVLGLGSFGEMTEDTEKIAKAVQSILNKTPYKLVNFMEIAWAGALTMQPGINVISDTSAIAYGRSEDGMACRCGGWGPVVGDEGSAYWVGEEFIRLFTMQSDGRLRKTALYSLIQKKFNLSNDFDIISIKRMMSRCEVASLTRLCSEATQKKDPQAHSIFERAAISLADLAEALVSKLNLNDPIMVSGTGDLFSANPLVPKAFALALNERGLYYQRPYMNGTRGAILMAKHYFDNHNENLTYEKKIKQNA